jgi:hypothetical protein
MMFSDICRTSCAISRPIPILRPTCAMFISPLMTTRPYLIYKQPRAALCDYRTSFRFVCPLPRGKGFG